MKTEIVSKTEKGMNAVVRTLNANGIIVYPTESSYGIGCLLKSKARKKIFKIKKRLQQKNLPVIVGNKEIISKYGVISREDKQLMKKFMPGPLSLHVNAKKNTPREFQENGIVFRIPAYAWIRRLSVRVNEPIISTSANISNQPALYDSKEVIKAFSGKVNLIVDGGKLPKRKPSTIYDTHAMKLIRKGPISEKEILKIVKGMK